MQKNFLARTFFVSLFIFTLSFFPLYRVEANPLFDAIADIFSGQNILSETNIISGEKNSQNMALVTAPLNSNLNQDNEKTDPIVAVEGSALSAALSVSPAGSNDTPKANASEDQISVYVVHNGDTISEIAKMFGVSANTIRFANDIPKGGSLHTGEQLVILPVSGIQYTIKKGDTINKIAKNYSADAQEIEDFNGIDDSSLHVGDTIIIPNGVEAPAPVVTVIKKVFTGLSNIISQEANNQADDNGYFVRPAKGTKTQGIHGHNGIDISGRGGLSVVAAASGKVIISLDSGYNGGYGHYVVIQHPNGMQTLYAHLSANFVSVGDMVNQGQLIGNIGSTGRSTGPHLHFEVRGGVNPF